METTTAPKPLPPFPKEKHWLFGSAYLLKGRSLEVIKMLSAKYGDIVSLTFPMNKVALVTNPQYAKYVLLDNNKNYRKSLAYDVLKAVLGNGLLTSEGDFWKKQRRLIQPAFHKRKLEELTDMMVEQAQHWVDKFDQHADTGNATDLAPELTALTLNVISKAIFSNGVEEKAEMVGEQISLLNQYAIDKVNDPFRLPAFIPTPFNIKERRSMKQLNDVIEDIISTRRKEESKDDLLSMLIDMRDEDTGEAMDNKQLRDEVMTIFIAGNETSSNALAWMLYLLSQNPEAEAKMVAEIDAKLDAGVELTYNNVLEFQYVRQVIDESLRIYPPAWSVGRRNYEEDEIGGYRIQKNTNVLIPIMYFHTSEKFWDEPAKFKPERFAPELRNKIDRFVYFPFGGGPRFCIGNNFALLEMQIILILFYRNFRFRLKEGFVPEAEPLITLRPKTGMWMEIERRK